MASRTVDRFTEIDRRDPARRQFVAGLEIAVEDAVRHLARDLIARPYAAAPERGCSSIGRVVRPLYSPPRSPWPPSARTKRRLRMLAAAALPAGTFLEGGGDGTVARLERWLGSTSPTAARGVRGSSGSRSGSGAVRRSSAHHAPARARDGVSSRGRRRRVTLSRACPPRDPHADQVGPLRRREDVRARRLPHPRRRPRATRDEPARWMQVMNGRRSRKTWSSSARSSSSAPARAVACAHELASRGHAVLLLEEGDYHRRSKFTTRAAEMSNLLYRDHGLTVAFGNAGIPTAGRAVGGTTRSTPAPASARRSARSRAGARTSGLVVLERRDGALLREGRVDAPSRAPRCTTPAAWAG